MLLGASFVEDVRKLCSVASLAHLTQVNQVIEAAEAKRPSKARRHAQRHIFCAATLVDTNQGRSGWWLVEKYRHAALLRSSTLHITPAGLATQTISVDVDALHQLAQETGDVFADVVLDAKQASLLKVVMMDYTRFQTALTAARTKHLETAGQGAAGVKMSASAEVRGGEEDEETVFLLNDDSLLADLNLDADSPGGMEHGVTASAPDDKTDTVSTASTASDPVPSDDRPVEVPKLLVFAGSAAAAELAAAYLAENSACMRWKWVVGHGGLANFP